jgi:hypothetical protein
MKKAKMKYKFNFIQIANWMYVCRQNLFNLRIDVVKEKISKNEAIEKLQAQKRHLLLIKDIVNRKTFLHGIQPDFLRNFKKIKEMYDIKD